MLEQFFARGGDAHHLQLVGRSAEIRAEIDSQLASAPASGAVAAAALATAAARVEIVDAPDVIAMTDKPSVAIRGKPESSMAVGIRLQAEGKSDAEVKRIVSDAAEFARTSPEPDPSELYTDVYLEARV